MKNNLKMIRKEANMTQVELAELCEVRQSTIAMIESGTNTPSIKLAKKICRVLHCTLEDLVGR